MEEVYYAYCKYLCGCMETIAVPKEEAGTFKELQVMCPKCRSGNNEIETKAKRKQKLIDDALGLTTINLEKESAYKSKELTGKSEKSIAYAVSLRKKFISKWTLNGTITEKALDILENETTDDFWLKNKDELLSYELLENYKKQKAQKIKLEKVALKGTEAQVKWAKTIRAEFANRMSDYSEFEEIISNEIYAKFWIDNRENIFIEEWLSDEYIPTTEVPTLKLQGTEKEQKKAKAIIKKFLGLSKLYLDETQKSKAQEFVLNQTAASWWIENADKFFNQDFISKATIIKAKREEQNEKLNSYKFKRDLMIAIYPEVEVFSEPIYVRIFEEEGTMIVESPKTISKELEKLLKENMIYYDGEKWKRNLDDRFTGDYVDRAAELGIKLLDNGYTVCAYSQLVRNNILRREYIPETLRWVVDIDGRHMAFLAREQEMIVDEIKLLPGAIYDNTIKGVIVPYDVSSIVKVLNVAKRHDFKLHEITKLKAKKLLYLVKETECKKIKTVKKSDKLKIF